MTPQLALTRPLVAHVRVLGPLGGTLAVLLRDGLVDGEFGAPAQLLSALGSLFTWRNGREPTLRRSRSISGAS